MHWSGVPITRCGAARSAVMSSSLWKSGWWVKMPWR